MSKKWSNYETGQRLEASDAINAAVDSHVDTMEAIGSDIMTAEKSYILSGFSVSTSTSTLTVNNGRAILGFQRAGQTRFGMVTTGGPASKNVDLSGLADGTYDIYIRFQFVEDDFANRFFWNPLAATPAETPANVATRLAEDWVVTVGSTSPGPEWVKIAEVVVAGGGTTFTESDAREFFFDTVSAEITNGEWGSDRTSVITSLRDMVMALARQVQDIIGDTDWKADPTAGIATGPFLRRDNSNVMLGTLEVNNPSAGLDSAINMSQDEASVDNRVFINSSPNSGPGGTTVELSIDAGANAGRIVLRGAEVEVEQSLIINGGSVQRQKMYSSLDAVFTPTNAAAVYLDRGTTQVGVEGAVLLQIIATTDPQRFWIPIHLPQNAVINGGAVIFSSNPNSNVRAGIGRQEISTGTRVSLKTGSPDFDTITVTTLQALTINESLAVRTVDNEQYAYYFFCYAPDGVPFFQGARVDYLY
jgi:hypothetical protein